MKRWIKPGWRDGEDTSGEMDKGWVGRWKKTQVPEWIKRGWKDGQKAGGQMNKMWVER